MTAGALVDVVPLDVLPLEAHAALDGSPALAQYDAALALALAHLDVVSAAQAEGHHVSCERSCMRACASLAFAHAIALAAWRERACA